MFLIYFHQMQHNIPKLIKDDLYSDIENDLSSKSMYLKGHIPVVMYENATSMGVWHKYLKTIKWRIREA